MSIKFWGLESITFIWIELITMNQEFTICKRELTTKQAEG